MFPWERLWQDVYKRQASTCAVLPLLIAFLSASKFFMSGLTSGAVKE